MRFQIQLFYTPVVKFVYIINRRGQMPEDEFQPRQHRSIKEWLADTYYNLVPFVSINLLWFPLLLLVVTTFPAIGGLF